MELLGFRINMPFADVLEKAGIFQDIKHSFAAGGKIMRAGDSIKRDILFLELLELFNHEFENIQRRQGSIEEVAGEEDKVYLFFNAIVDSLKKGLGGEVAHLRLAPRAKVGISQMGKTERHKISKQPVFILIVVIEKAGTII